MDKPLIGLIAQWIEHPPSKRVVAGSNPAQSVFEDHIMSKKNEKLTSVARLGDYKFERPSFPNLDEVFSEFSKTEFKKRSSRKRFHRVNQVLLQLIMETPKETFLLPAVVEFIDRVNRDKILNDPYHISLFEFWLNHFSELSEQDNYFIRGKIAGKYIPRDDYQAFFPIGMNKTFSGTHFVAAHLSPDVDTMVASFWGWMDAFAARIGNATHIWSLPGGPPDSPVTNTFATLFGKTLFTNVANSSMSLTLSAIDLVTQKGFSKYKGNVSISSLDLSSGEKAAILVNEDGFYLGEWHRADVDPVRQIIIRFRLCLRWFETNLHVKLISFFAKKKLHIRDITSLLSSVFDVPIYDCEPVHEFTQPQKKDLHDFFSKVLGMEKGLKSTFRELNEALARLSVRELMQFQEEIESLQKSDLFDDSGNLREDRPVIFHRLEKLIHQLDHAIQHARDYAERLDVAMNIKTKVLGKSAQYVTTYSDIEDIRIRMQNQEYLTVVIIEGEDKLFPVGVVWGHILQRQPLGTVTFRDFCNQEEVRMAPYLTPISVIDHHKTSLKTNSPPMAIIGDAQSCNVLIAEQAFGINDRYSLGGMTPQQIEKEILALRQQPHRLTNIRLMQRLLHRHLAIDVHKKYYIHPHREMAEYFCFLLAILDDTDLITKVSKRDIECIVELLNRIKSLTVQEEVEAVNLDDIPRDQNFVSTAAKRILQNEEMYSFYRKVYESKEQEVERNLNACKEGQYEPLFVDTKEQNRCCRVGQTKLFTINFPTYEKNAASIMQYWTQTAEAVNREHPEIDLHLHMISTVPSADEVYQDKVGQYSHLDELWFWVPPSRKAYDHLTSFLTAFLDAQKFDKDTQIEFFPGTSDEMQQIFILNCPDIPKKMRKGPALPLVILRFKAGMLNSRKAMITPYLPRILG